MTQKFIVNAKGLSGKRTNQLFVLSDETLDFVSRITTRVRGQRFDVVATVAKTNHATHTLTTEDGRRYRFYDDKSVVELG